MPKRPNPFGDCSPLQLKQHVGTREVDMGVAHNENMKKVYERTRSLLFTGSKKSFDTPVDANCNNIYMDMNEVEMLPDTSQNSRQMRISASGQLCTDKITENKPKDAFEALMFRRAVTSSGSCQCCKGQAASQDRCGFCEKSICYDCVRTCDACEVTSSGSCQCCKGQAASQDRCGFCEKSICYDCVRMCDACEGHFCQLCSVMNPNTDSIEDKWYCQKCSYRLNPFIYWSSAS